MSTVQFLAKSGAVVSAAALAGAMLGACDAGAGSRAAMMAQTAAAAQQGVAPALRHQWQRNGVDIPGATRDYLLLPTATLADDGARYTVVVRNGVGRVASRPGVLALVSADTELPWR